MKNLIIGLILLFSPFIILAHNPLSAKYHFEAGENASILTINLSQNGVNQVLLKKYGEEKINSIEQKEFKELIVDYVKSNFEMSINQETIELKKGGIKLGSHQTDLKFVLPPVSKDIENFSVAIPAFKENKNHQTIFSYTFLGKSDRIILGENNNYQSTINLNTATIQTASINWLFIVLGSLVVIGGVFFGIKNRRKRGVLLVKN